jgi:signal transduction histidine kinase
VKVNVDDPLPPILADAAALQMILRNLVENSVRHARVERLQLQLSAQRRGSQVLLEYQDNGEGTAVPGRELGRVFGRGDNSKGTGIGLYLVRALMQRMGGEAQFHSAPGAGFRAELLFNTSGESAT